MLRTFWSCASVADALQVTLDDPPVIPNDLQEATLSIAGTRLTQELDLLPESFWISTDLFDHCDVFGSWRLVAWKCMLPFKTPKKTIENIQMGATGMAVKLVEHLSKQRPGSILALDDIDRQIIRGSTMHSEGACRFVGPVMLPGTLPPPETCCVDLLWCSRLRGKSLQPRQPETDCGEAQMLDGKGAARKHCWMAIE